MDILQRISDKFEKYVEEVGMEVIYAVSVSSESGGTVYTIQGKYLGSITELRFQGVPYVIRSTVGGYNGHEVIKRLGIKHRATELVGVLKLLQRYEECLDIVYKAQLQNIDDIKELFGET